MTGQDDEPVFAASDVRPEEAGTAARAAEAANALVSAAGGRLNPVELAAIARTRLDDFISRDVLPALDAPPACRRGCAWCCHSAVSASIAEAASVAVYILTTKTSAAQEEIQRRLDVYVSEASGLTAEGRLQSKKPCPFLAGDECTVYAVRPLICAGYLSPTPDACERVTKDPEETTLRVRGAMEKAEFLCLVLAKMFGAFDVEAETVDLAGAVRIILQDPTSFDRWCGGEKVFSATFISRLMGGAAHQEEEDVRRYDRTLPALLEELERRAGVKAAASTREAWERWRRDGLHARTPLPALIPRS